MSRPNCPFCNAGPKGDWAESETPWFNCGTMIDRDRTSRADQTNQCVENEVGRLKDRIADLEEMRTKAAANSLSNMLTHEGALLKIAALTKAGNGLEAIVRRDYKGAFCEAWTAAKATKPTLHPDFRAGEMVTAPPVAGERHPRPVKVGDDVNSQGHPAEAVQRTKEVPCSDCYGGHFRPCQLCGDSGVALLLIEDKKEETQP